jgi:hypothetical protein
LDNILDGFGDERSLKPFFDSGVVGFMEEWELTIDGIKTVERKLRELLPSPDSPNENIFIDERKSIQDFIEESMT